MSTRMYGPEEKAKLERLINEGSNVLRELEDLQFSNLRQKICFFWRKFLYPEDHLVSSLSAGVIVMG